MEGGIRDGLDVLKALAFGADAVLIGRPFCLAAVGGGSEGVKLTADHLYNQLVRSMVLTGYPSVREAGRHLVSTPISPNPYGVFMKVSLPQRNKLAQSMLWNLFLLTVGAVFFSLGAQAVARIMASLPGGFSVPVCSAGIRPGCLRPRSGTC